MAINFTDFSQAKIQESPWANVFENALKGYQIGQEPAKMAAKAQEQKLANSLKELALKHAPEEWEMKKQLNQAQINKANRVSTGGGLKLTGDIANYKLTHPEANDDDIRKFADRLLESKINHTISGTNRSNILNDTQNDRAPRSPVAKDHYEIEQINKGEMPYSQGKVKLNPEQQAKMRNDLLLDVVKKTTDPATRTKLQNSVNMNITLDSIDSNALTKYSGIEGATNKYFDQILEGADVGSKQYQDYVHETIKASAAAKQMRQYLGDSIQPSAQERLDHLTNPSAWNVSPKVAKENFDFIRDLYKRETQTLVRAATDPTLYQSQAQTQASGSQDLVYNPATGRLE